MLERCCLGVESSTVYGGGCESGQIQFTNGWREGMHTREKTISSFPGGGVCSQCTEDGTACWRITQHNTTRRSYLQLRDKTGVILRGGGVEGSGGDHGEAHIRPELCPHVL